VLGGLVPPAVFKIVAPSVKPGAGGFDSHALPLSGGHRADADLIDILDGELVEEAATQPLRQDGSPSRQAALSGVPSQQPARWLAREWTNKNSPRSQRTAGAGKVEEKNRGDGYHNFVGKRSSIARQGMTRTPEANSMGPLKRHVCCRSRFPKEGITRELFDPVKDQPFCSNAFYWVT
jgi:hypothetical protein